MNEYDIQRLQKEYEMAKTGAERLAKEFMEGQVKIAKTHYGLTDTQLKTILKELEKSLSSKKGKDIQKAVSPQGKGEVA